MSKMGRVLVAMSGGIDSTVAALMLHEQGYEVIGVTMKTWDYNHTVSTNGKETGCCSLDSLQDARSLAVKMGFHHFILDIREEFGDSVIENFVEEYLAGRTPNPCVLCNTHIKWSALLKRADALDCHYIATGHYARTNHDGRRHWISKARDLNKDQSYVLWGLSQDSLARSLYPLAEWEKPQVREFARERGFESLSKKAESYEICFVPDNDYRSFIRYKEPDLSDSLKGGPFVDQTGKVVGKHEGYPFYTIGQRKGLGLAFGKPMFVTHIDPLTNTVYLGEESDLEKDELLISTANFQKWDKVVPDKEVVLKIRYKDIGHSAFLTENSEGIHAHFKTLVKGVAPGQSAVVYEGDDLVLGGIIQRSAFSLQTQTKPLHEENFIH